ncbi:low molecular weight protein-tyrosine-phosphatase [Cupriavidus sp. AcVe19-1a]|uniref:low molecular weight protein-tyrosine-phosphatase n=1 Tax=Cupriavidus sp. AcVe19-1a TaxID=2821359 RepID=UPI001AE6097C|nr:low molecular weight protein-tyrosine-phosphatase [Cupriavidus sp. AcVe19-1a]MBP0630558.1 low molecular weight phosphotyrosine protein phosphatase [Cupriavidus sp. AcVe19-1a]
MIKTVLVVCIGNICRSPMAEGLLKHALPKLTVSSAGIAALVGRSADPISVDLLAKGGLDISSHRARQLTGIEAAMADLILVMDQKQKHDIASKYPHVSGKIFRLGEFGKFDIPDPYRKPRSDFESALKLIDLGLKAWVSKISAVN